MEGGRATGKTTLRESLAPALGIAEAIDLSDPAVREEAEADPRGFTEALERPAFIDEAQLVPELTLAIKRIADRTGEPAQFLLTGSSRRGRQALGGSDPLVGRALRLSLRPFAVSERDGRPHGEVDRWFEHGDGSSVSR